MRHALRLDCLVALEIQKRVYVAVAGGVTVESGDDVGACRMPDLGLGLDRVREGVDDEVGADVGVAEALGQAVGERLLEAVMVEDQREDEAAECWLMPGNRFGLHADAAPDGIDFLDGLSPDKHSSLPDSGSHYTATFFVWISHASIVKV